MYLSFLRACLLVLLTPLFPLSHLGLFLGLSASLLLSPPLSSSLPPLSASLPQVSLGDVRSLGNKTEVIEAALAGKVVMG